MGRRCSGSSKPSASPLWQLYAFCAAIVEVLSPYRRYCGSSKPSASLFWQLRAFSDSIVANLSPQRHYGGGSKPSTLHCGSFSKPSVPPFGQLYQALMQIFYFGSSTKPSALQVRQQYLAFCAVIVAALLSPQAGTVAALLSPSRSYWSSSPNPQRRYCGSSTKTSVPLVRKHC